MTDQPKAELFVSSTRWHAGVATRERAVGGEVRCKLQYFCGQQSKIEKKSYNLITHARFACELIICYATETSFMHSLGTKPFPFGMFLPLYNSNIPLMFSGKGTLQCGNTVIHKY